MTDESDIYVPKRELSTLNDDSDFRRIKELKETFKAEYLTEPTFVVRVPGRVNLIGEHIDYCGYPVFPMAIQQSILLAVCPSNDNILHLKNTNPKYHSFKTSLSDFVIDLPENGAPNWYSYFLCGVKGILEHLKEEENLMSQTGFMVVISGNVPPSAGLSSSSALVSAAVLGTAFLHKVPLKKQTLATIAAKCERYIGTQGGGMDQAIAFLAKQGTAQYIEWNPLKATPVELPANAIFVIANSLSEANKAASHHFNQRVVECRLGCRLIAKKLNLSWREITRFADLQALLKCSLNEMIQYAEKFLTEKSYNVNELLSIFEITEEDFHKNLLSHNTQHLQDFKLRQRALHVLQEAQRVEKFREAAVNGSSIEILAKLMNESHDSLDDLYECSNSNLNELVTIGRSTESGIRLTGAGFGGCVVALCDSIAKCEKFMTAAKEKYFKKLLENGKLKEEELENVLFMTSPQRGAEILML
ncbi:N-acetylgalactosamine kinase [Culicoides brevitarsis]|uniref:N-acetylgalactosamine kinase n=1 Tax=Culicoides brevitarsis TaxID=469753 RepID=UPI00307C1800